MGAPDEDDPLAETEVGAPTPPRAAMAETQVDESATTRTAGVAAGTKIGRFTVIEKLGHGGMGVVIAAYDPELDRRVAIKMLHDDISGSHGARLEREAKAMAQLNHPNVVTVHETGRFGERLYIAMEYVEGKTLGQWLRAQPRTRDEILDVVVQAGRGLAAAHAVGLVHRDFKPDNVLVGKDGRVRVSDFGLVSSAGDRTTMQAVPTKVDVFSPSALTQTGAVMGTPLYMAPEQHDGRVADDKADQFSFCVSLWQALCDDLPYGADTYEDLKANVTGGKLRAVPRGARVSAKLREILARGLSADPAERWPSMTALLAAIERTRRPRRWPWLVAVGIVLAGGGAAAALLLRGSGVDPCAGGEQRLAGVWDAPRRAALAASFKAAGIPEEDLQHLTTALDGYAMSWVGKHREVCRATHVRGEQSAELLDLRMHCLDERLAGVGALVARFGEAKTRADAYRALDAVSGVSSLAECDDTQRLRAAIPPPADPAKRTELAALEKRLAEVVSYDRMGQWKHAAELRVPLEVDAKRLGYAPLLAKLVLLRAGEQFHDGALEDAVQSYKDAAEAGATAKDDETIAQAWADLVSLDGARGKYAEALELASIAKAATERVSDRPLLGARFANALAGIYLAQGKYPDAKSQYERALELVRKDGTDNELIGPALTNYATAAWYVGDEPGAAKYFEDARVWFVKRYGPRHPSLGYIERDLGDLAAHKQDMATAIPHYEEALAIFEGAHGPDHIDDAIALEPLCYAYAMAGRTAKAREVGERALAIREHKLGPEHPALVQTLQMLSDADVAEGTPAALETAAQRLARARAIAEKALGPDAVPLAEVLERAATVESKRGHAQAAYEDLERALAIRRKAAGDHTADTARDHLSIGEVETNMKRWADALADFERAEQIEIAIDPKDPEIARVRYLRADVLAKLGRTAEAIALAKSGRAQVEGNAAAKPIADQIDKWLAAHAR